MSNNSKTAERDDETYKRLRRLETIEGLLDFDLPSQSQYADDIAEERQRLTIRLTKK